MRRLKFLLNPQECVMFLTAVVATSFVEEGWSLIACFIVAKHALRRLFRALPMDFELKDRLFFLLEHAIFSITGTYAIIYAPGPHRSWFIHPELCWVSVSSDPNQLFSLYYLAKVGSHVEDLLFVILKVLSHADTQGIKGRDIAMDVHHVTAAWLCIASYMTGYLRIGSLVMLLHDSSDIPLDLLRIGKVLQVDMAWMAVCLICTVLSWLYWRLWVLCMVVIRTILFDAKSLLFPCDDEGLSATQRLDKCFLAESTERVAFIAPLTVLLVLHVHWLQLLVAKGYRELSAATR